MISGRYRNDYRKKKNHHIHKSLYSLRLRCAQGALTKLCRIVGESKEKVRCAQPLHKQILYRKTKCVWFRLNLTTRKTIENKEGM